MSPASSDRDRVTRRRLLDRLGVSAATFVAGLAQRDATPEPDRQEASTRTSEALDSQAADVEWHRVDGAASLAVNDVLSVEVPAGDGELHVRIARVAEGDDGIRAVDGRCSHRGCAVRSLPGSRRFVCPCHGGVFDLEGRPRSGPPAEPLRRLAVRSDRDGIYVGFPLGGTGERQVRAGATARPRSARPPR